MHMAFLCFPNASTAIRMHVKYVIFMGTDKRMTIPCLVPPHNVLLDAGTVNPQTQGLS